jgi:hypothetical protein
VVQPVNAIAHCDTARGGGAVECPVSDTIDLDQRHSSVCSVSFCRQVFGPLRRTGGRAHEMIGDQSLHKAASPPGTENGGRTAASYERELTAHRCAEASLRTALAEEGALLHQRDELIRNQQLASEESDHRLLNYRK